MPLFDLPFKLPIESLQVEKISFNIFIFALPPWLVSGVNTSTNLLPLPLILKFVLVFFRAGAIFPFHPSENMAKTLPTGMLSGIPAA